MNNEILFSERQQYRTRRNGILLLALSVYFIFRSYNKIISEDLSFFKFNFPAIILLLLALLFMTIRIDTEIREDGIYYQLFPFQFKMKKISFDDIEKIYVRQYNPIMEYGGWGIRIGLFGKGWAINITGNKGIQILFKEKGKRKFLLGTQKPDEVEAVLDRMKLKIT